MEYHGLSVEMFDEETCIKLAKKNKMISRSIIKKDIKDTKHDIAMEEKKLGLGDGRFDWTYRARIKDMCDFMEQLQMILVGKDLLDEK